MFALHKVVDRKLYALVINPIEDDHEQTDALYELFENWQNVSYLNQFFKRNPNTLAYLGLSLKHAVEQVLYESESFYSTLIEACKSDDFSERIDELFEPLHKSNDPDFPILQLKAYGGRSRPCITRLYAVRLDDNAIIIVGGLIKTAQALQQTKEGRSLLKLINELTTFLTGAGLINSNEIVKITQNSELYDNED
jgi:hypothetical protein